MKKRIGKNIIKKIWLILFLIFSFGAIISSNIIAEISPYDYDKCIWIGGDNPCVWNVWHYNCYCQDVVVNG